MSTFVCSSCTRSFAEAGFCPYDGTQLAAAKPSSDGAPTLVTARELSGHAPDGAAGGAGSGAARLPERTMTVPQFGGATGETKLPPGIRPERGAASPASPASLASPASPASLASPASPASPTSGAPLLPASAAPSSAVARPTPPPPAASQTFGDSDDPIVAVMPTMPSGMLTAVSLPGDPTAQTRAADLPTRRDPVMASAMPTAPSKPPSKPPGNLRSVSASESPEKALANLRRGTEYDQLVGETLDGRYFIERKIGEGGMGVVYSARHAVIERPLAVKVLKREALRDSATATRFVQEAKAASRIGHPNIVDVTDFGTTADGLHYSVMEYVKGVTLALVIKANAPLPLPRAFAIAQQLARGLGAAHDKGIVHRDLKPENIFLVDRDGRSDFVKIVDFGIAKVTPIDGQQVGPKLTRAGSVFGTPEYMAPEQAAGRSDIDGRVDIYALGVILYEMITGKLPLKGESAVRTIAMQLLDPIVPPSQLRPDLSIPPECEAIVMKALAKRRDERYRTMAELQLAIEQWLSRVRPRSAVQPVAGLMPLPPGADPRVVDSLQTPLTGIPSAMGIPQAIGTEPSRSVRGPEPSQATVVLRGGDAAGREPSGAVRMGHVAAASGRAQRPSESPLSGRAQRPSESPLSGRAQRPSESPLSGRAQRPSESPLPGMPAPPGAPGNPPSRAHRPSQGAYGPAAGSLGAVDSSHGYPPQAVPIVDASALPPQPQQRSVRDEPEFVKTGVASFDHVFLEAPPPPPSRRWPWIALALLFATGAGAAIAVVAQRKPEQGQVVAVASDARMSDPEIKQAVDAPRQDPGAAALRDGGNAGSLGDAGSGGNAGSGDGSDQPPGANPPPRDGGSSRPPRDRRDARSQDPKREVTVQILTYPEEGTVYRGRSYRGPAGTTVVEPYGTVARFTCTKVGYKEGYVDVKFDEKTPIAVCVMTRKKLCVDDLKNPYDHCPDAGAR